MYRYAGYTYILYGSWQMNVAVVMYIFVVHIKFTIGLSFVIVSDSEVLFISAELQDELIAHGIKS